MMAAVPLSEERKSCEKRPLFGECNFSSPLSSLSECATNAAMHHLQLPSSTFLFRLFAQCSKNKDHCTEDQRRCYGGTERGGGADFGRATTDKTAAAVTGRTIYSSGGGGDSPLSSSPRFPPTKSNHHSQSPPAPYSSLSLSFPSESPQGENEGDPNSEKLGGKGATEK